MTKSHFKGIAGPIAAAIGVGLMMGGFMLSLVAMLSPKFPRAFLVAGVCQALLGLLCVVGGLLLWRGSAVAKYILVLVGIGVVANTVFYAANGVWEMRSHHVRQH